MKSLLQVACGALFAVTLVSSSVAQTASGVNDQQQVARAVKELQEQQAAIAQNQAKIEEKLALITEAIRQARIFASRAGAGKR